MNIAQTIVQLYSAQNDFDRNKTIKHRLALKYRQREMLKLVAEVLQETRWCFDRRQGIYQAVANLEDEGVYIVASTICRNGAWLARMQIQTVMGDSVWLLEDKAQCPRFLRSIVESCLVEAAGQDVTNTSHTSAQQ